MWYRPSTIKYISFWIHCHCSYDTLKKRVKLNYKFYYIFRSFFIYYINFLKIYHDYKRSMITMHYRSAKLATQISFSPSLFSIPWNHSSYLRDSFVSTKWRLETSFVILYCILNVDPSDIPDRLDVFGFLLICHSLSH